MSIYDTLNEQQKLGVMTTEGPVLILAGAGSGKTRVLTHRTAYLIEEKGVNPYNIMAITFTNKAAGEMRERINALVGYGSESIWVSTFHSTCVRILRRHIDRIGYDTNFTIYDSDDSKSVMKEICKRLNIDTKIYKERSLLAAISSAKDELVSPTQFALQASASSDFAKKKQKVQFTALGMNYAKRKESYAWLIQRKKPKTALFFLSDLYALEAISFFSSRGVKIPKEIGIAGYDNISYAEFSVPRLTTISQNVEQKASLAVEILMERINGVEKERENQIELPVTLIPRKSVQPQDEN